MDLPRTDPASAVELETGPEPRAAVLWLHGIGADGHDFAPIVPALGLRGAPAVRFVFPHAPYRPVTFNGGAVMRAWYDIYGVDGAPQENEAGLRAAQEALEALIAREKARGVPASALVLGGFSQGGILALQTGLRHAERLAGVMALSAYLPLARTLRAEASEANRRVPIFFGHGLHDPLLPIARARRSRDVLREAGYDVEWHEYDIGHTVSALEVGHVGAWLRRVLGGGAGDGTSGGGR